MGPSAFAGQEMQALDPVTDLYLPATHCTQRPPSGPSKPALHIQLVSDPLPSGEYVFAGQPKHAASETAAVSLLYLPREHGVQAAEPFEPVLVK